MNCVKCNLQLNVSTQYYLIKHLGPELSSLFQASFIGEVYEDAYICDDCFNSTCHQLATADVSAVDVPTLHNDNSRFCVWCGVVIIRAHATPRRFHALPEGLERDEIASRIAPRQIPEGGRVCYGCWQRARRYVKAREPNIQQHSAGHSVESLHGEPEISYLRLPNYRCSGRSESRCFVHGCTNTDRLRVPLLLKQRLLREYKFYIMPHARICRYHLCFYDWELLNEGIYLNHFTSSDIENMMDLLRSVSEQPSMIQ